MNVVVYGGAGGVGSSLAFNLLARGGGHDVTIVDPREHVAISHAMDLEQVLEQGCSGSLRSAGEEAVADADVLVVCASIFEQRTTSRMDFLEGNAVLVRHIAKLLRGGFGGVVLMVTNPVDPLVALLARESGIDRRRLIGYTLNDSLRLRTGIARALGLSPPGRVEAWVLGEHGDASVPLFSRVRVDGEPLALSAAQRDEVLGFTRTWFARHKGLEAGRSSTWTSGLGTARMVEALGRDDGGALFPGSVLLDGEYGVDGVAIGVPVRLARGGVGEILEWELSDEEHAALRESAATVRRALDAVSAGGAAAGV